MPLETGTYIKELDRNNPVNATDIVGEGDDHLRLIKKCLQNSFPAFVGTAAAPKSVSLSEDQINDAALKSATNTFAAETTFNSRITMANGIPIAGKNLAGTPVNIASVSAADYVEFGNTSLDLHLHYSGAQGHWFYHGGASGTNRVFNTASRANGSLQIADSGGTFGNVAAVHKAQTFTGTQNYQARTFFEAEPRLNNNTALQSINVAGTLNKDVIKFDSLDRVVIGASADEILANGAKLTALHGGSIVAETATRANGSLLVYDRFGAAAKVGFRLPKWRSQTVDYSTSQDDEGTILNTSVSNLTYTLNQLEAFTTFRIVNRSGGNLNIAQGTGVTITARLGGSAITGNLVIAANSIVEVSYRSATQVDVFGNGIS